MANMACPDGNTRYLQSHHLHVDVLPGKRKRRSITIVVNDDRLNHSVL